VPHIVKLLSYCSVLQCVAVCCSVLQCVAVCCSVLQCVASYFHKQALLVQGSCKQHSEYTTHTATHCSILKRTATHSEYAQQHPLETPNPKSSNPPPPHAANGMADSRLPIPIPNPADGSFRGEFPFEIRRIWNMAPNPEKSVIKDRNNARYGKATISRLLKIIRLFCQIYSLL